MGIAEDEISAGKLEHPKKAKEIQASFLAFQPYLPEFWNAPDEVFRAHCKEIVARIVSGAKLDPATDAEILYGLYMACQKAPPGDHFQLLYERLFIRIYPKQKVFSGAICRESWPNACPKPQLLGF